MKTILRNFFSVLSRFKTAMTLNVLGLSVAFTAFMMIMMQVYYDYTFDKFHQDATHIFRLDLKSNQGSQAVVSRPFTRLFAASSPHILGDVIMQPFLNDLIFQVEKDGKKVQFREKSMEASNGLMKVFHFEMKEGTEKAFDEPDVVLLPESMAEKIFGNESALGKLLLRPGTTPVRVGGVYKDFAENTSLANVIYGQIDPKENYDDWGNWNYTFFFRLDNPEVADDIIPNFKKNDDLKNVFGNDFTWEKSGMDLLITSLPDLHFVKSVLFDTLPKASHQTLKVLFAIAFIIILIAGINFTNFSTALTPMRIKSINTQKVLGSNDSTLRNGLLGEALCVSLFAFVLSLFILQIVQKTDLALMVDANLSFSDYPLIFVGTGVLAVVVGLLAGIYPSIYMTSFPPALVLKGSFGLSPKGRKMRNILVGIQFVASFALIIGAIFMYLQNQYMQHSSLGYEKDAVIISDMNGTMKKNRDAFRNTIKGFSEMEDVAFANAVLASGDNYMTWGREFRNGENINFTCIPVSSDFLKVMGIQVNNGRDFSKDDESRETLSYIFNEAAIAKYNLTLEDKIGEDAIVGFIPDIKITSFRKEASPMAFLTSGKGWTHEEALNYAYIKVKAGSNLRTAMEHVRESFAKFDAEYPFDIRFYDAVLQQTYEKELKIGSLITLFSLVAIFISIVGVFGLVVFESEYRRKEIAVRKVLGSSTGEILVMFNKNYIVILALCFIMGAPVAWYAIYRWLENFAYRTPMYWWVLPLAFVIVAIITILTVTYQNWHVANENPVKNVKSE